LTIAIIGIVLPNSLAQGKKGDPPPIVVPEFNFDEESGLISYKEVVELSGSKADLYKNGLKWCNTFFKSPTNVIKEKDETGGKIYGKHRFNLRMIDPKTGISSNMGLMMYEITLWFKDGRYRYELTKFNWKKASAYPMKKLLEENNKKYVREYASHLTQSDEYAKDLIKNLKDYMAADHTPKKDDW